MDTIKPNAAPIHVSDLTDVAALLEVAISRGAYRANEIERVGQIYNKLANTISTIKNEEK